MSDEEDELGVIRQEWVDDEHTRKLLKEIYEKKDQHLNKLLGECGRSSDSNVIRAFVVYAECLHRIKLFETGRSKPNHKTYNPEQK